MNAEQKRDIRELHKNCPTKILGCHVCVLLAALDREAALEVACRQLVGAEFGSNAWAESWDNLEAVLGMRESGG